MSKLLQKMGIKWEFTVPSKPSSKTELQNGQSDNLGKEANDVIGCEFKEVFMATCLSMGTPVEKPSAQSVFAGSNAYTSPIWWNFRDLRYLQVFYIYVRHTYVHIHTSGKERAIPEE